MTCVICKHGETQPGMVNTMLQCGSCTVIFKDMPADLCDNCAEYYFSETVTQELLRRAEQAALNGAEVEILRYAA